MWLEIGVMHKLARANPCAIDHEIEFFIHIFELFESDVRVDFAASFAKARGEVIEINRSVHQRDLQRKPAGELMVILSGSRMRGSSEGSRDQVKVSPGI